MFHAGEGDTRNLRAIRAIPYVSEIVFWIYDSTSGKLRNVQNDDKNPEKHDGTDSMTVKISVAIHPGDLDCRIFTIFLMRVRDPIHVQLLQ